MPFLALELLGRACFNKKKFLRYVRNATKLFFLEVITTSSQTSLSRLSCTENKGIKEEKAAPIEN